MFTGIIEAIGTISRIEQKQADSRFVFATESLDLSDVKIGDSIAVNGVCLTVIDRQPQLFTADLSKETLATTTFSGLHVGSHVNLEKAMRLSDRLNGYLVSGHVDGIGQIIAQFDEGRSTRYTIKLPSDLIKFIAKKGSITIDGVNLTVNQVDAAKCSVNIIPHTLTATIFSEYELADNVNIEVDLIARYLNQLMQSV